MQGWCPCSLLGLAEDIRKSVSVRLRLGVALIAGALAYGLAGVRVQALGLPVIDELIHSLPVISVLAPLLFTLVAVAGMVHAMNIVDGLNGLLAGITLTILGVLAAVSASFQEHALLMLALTGMAATAGFAVFNFPRARLFCGDAGAYLIGYLIAVIVILLVQRQPGISPWFALAVVIHPVTETLYSAWRRVRLGLSPTHPDARHMHSLWAANLQQRSDESGQSIWLGANAGASWRTLVVASLPVRSRPPARRSPWHCKASAWPTWRCSSSPCVCSSGRSTARRDHVSVGRAALKWACTAREAGAANPSPA